MNNTTLNIQQPKEVLSIPEGRPMQYGRNTQHAIRDTRNAQRPKDAIRDPQYSIHDTDAIHNTQYAIRNHHNVFTAENKRTLLNSFVCAWQGLKLVFKSQRNVRLHILAALSVGVLSIVFRVPYLEIVILFLAITFVIVSEIINTALELSLDFINGKKFHPLVKAIKDVVAAAVLLASINALIIGTIIFIRHII